MNFNDLLSGAWNAQRASIATGLYGLVGVPKPLKSALLGANIVDLTVTPRSFLLNAEQPPTIDVNTNDPSGPISPVWTVTISLPGGQGKPALEIYVDFSISGSLFLEPLPPTLHNATLRFTITDLIFIMQVDNSTDALKAQSADVYFFGDVSLTSSDGTELLRLTGAPDSDHSQLPTMIQSKMQELQHAPYVGANGKIALVLESKLAEYQQPLLPDGRIAVTLDLFGETPLVIKIFGHDIELINKPLFGIHQFETLLSRHDLPIRWGHKFPAAYPDKPDTRISPEDLHKLATGLEATLAASQPYGAAIDRVNAKPIPGQPNGVEADYYVGERDSADWTGHLLAAKAFKVATIHRDTPGGDTEKQALTELSDVLSQVERLFLQPQSATIQPKNLGAFYESQPLMLRLNTGLMCRAALDETSAAKTRPALNNPGAVPPAKNRPACESKTAFAKISAGVNNYYPGAKLIKPDIKSKSGQDWYGFGRDADPVSRDQVTGVMFGLGAVLELVEDQDARARAAGIAAACVNYLIINNWNYPTPAERLGESKLLQKTSQLTVFYYMTHLVQGYLKVAATGDPARFENLYDDYAKNLANSTWLNPFFNALFPTDSDHYYKYYIDFEAITMLLAVGKPDKQNAEMYEQALAVLRNALGHHRNAFFDLLWAWCGKTDAGINDRLDSQVPYAYEGGVGDDTLPTVRQEVLRLLQEWYLRNKIVQGAGGLPRQMTPDPNYIRNLKTTGNNLDAGLASDAAAIADYALPVDKRSGANADFIWQRSPFFLGRSVEDCNCSHPGVTVSPGCPDTVSPGVDYLLPYWMARYLRVFEAGKPIAQSLTPIQASSGNAARGSMGVMGPQYLPRTRKDEPDTLRRNALRHLKDYYSTFEVIHRICRTGPPRCKGASENQLKFSSQTLYALFAEYDPGSYAAVCTQFQHACRNAMIYVDSNSFTNQSITIGDWFDTQYSGVSAFDSIVDLIFCTSTGEYRNELYEEMLAIYPADYLAVKMPEGARQFFHVDDLKQALLKEVPVRDWHIPPDEKYNDIGSLAWALLKPDMQRSDTKISNTKAGKK